MKLILRGRRFGFSLEDIRQWLMIYGQKGTVEQYRVWIELADRQYDLLAQQQAELEATMRELHDLRDGTQKLIDEMTGSEAPST
ncbi:MerR family DNA-binding protein [Paracoccus cavernae]